MSKPVIRCAIYTRKSSDEGLDQAFNSLDAQYEACSAYITSQRHEGWRLVPSRFDDGGISGGTLERPALQRLIAEIEAGRIDMVVVYKIDRLTRSLSDFVRLVEQLDAAGCSFVSVTQAFNTSSSMGRLTLNVLLSFAQFEREVTAERIRDKIAASKKKGLWMGGLPPLGYDPHPDPQRRELVVNEYESQTVRQLFTLYAEHGNLRRVEEAAAQQGLQSKLHRFASGRTQGGGALSRGQIHKILTNPVYRGQIRHKDKCYPGAHTAIIDEALWDAVQAKLVAASGKRRGGATDTTGKAALLGKVFDETGDHLTPSHTIKAGRKIRYYVSNRLISGGVDPSGWRVPAAALEAAVGQSLASHLARIAKAHQVSLSSDFAEAARAACSFAEVAADMWDASVASRKSALSLVHQVRIGRGTLQIGLNPVALAAAIRVAPADLAPSVLTFEAPFVYRRRGVEMRIVSGEIAPAPDPTLLRALRNAHRWTEALKSGTPLGKLASSEGISERYLARIVPLAGLSPRIQ